MDPFTTGTIELSMMNPETGNRLEANVYYVDGVLDATGAPRPLSMNGLVMAVCLSRATELEADIVALMEAMAENTKKLEYYSAIEAEMANWYEANPETTFVPADITRDLYPELYDLIHREEGGDQPTWKEFLEEVGEDSSKTSWTYDEFEKLMMKLEDKMDSLNTLSQEQLIDIQSQTSKRDDTYNLISNMLKSMNTVLTGNVNNL